MSFGSKTGIELEESEGTIAGENAQEWYLGDTLSAAIGQSYNSYTPLQLVNYVAAIANGGKLNKLTLIKDIVNSNTGSIDYAELKKYIEKQNGYSFEEKNIDVSEEALKVVREGMYRCTSEIGGGVYYTFLNSGLSIAGKTGTAEVSEGQPTALFVGFVPYESPRVAIAVVIEHGNTSHYAAEVARDILQKYYKIYEEDNKNVSSQVILRPEVKF